MTCFYTDDKSFVLAARWFVLEMVFKLGLIKELINE